MPWLSRAVYVLVCSALMLAFFLGLRFMIYGINDSFGIGFGLGMTLGVFIGAIGTIIECREKAIPRLHATRRR